MAWTNDSGRTEPLPSNWYTQIQPRILIRDNHVCMYGMLDVDQYALGECNDRATEVDHMHSNTDHSDANLRSLCTDHHAQRTSRQGNAARWRYRAARPRERHPGILPE